jgi:hypothetical protein
MGAHALSTLLLRCQGEINILITTDIPLVWGITGVIIIYSNITITISIPSKINIIPLQFVRPEP